MTAGPGPFRGKWSGTSFRPGTTAVIGGILQCFVGKGGIVNVLLGILLDLAALSLGVVLTLLILGRTGHLVSSGRLKDLGTALTALAFLLVVASHLVLAFRPAPAGQSALGPDPARDPRLRTVVQETLRGLEGRMPGTDATMTNGGAGSGATGSAAAAQPGTAPSSPALPAQTLDPSVRSAVQEGLKALQARNGGALATDPASLGKALQGFLGAAPAAATPAKAGDSAALTSLLADLGKGLDAYKNGGQTEESRAHLVDLLRNALDQGTLDSVPLAKKAAEQMVSQGSASAAPEPVAVPD
jgi:hypothetical protein